MNPEDGLGSVTDDAVIRAIEASAQWLSESGDPSRGPVPAAGELARRSADAAAALKASARAELMPLAYELHRTADWLASNAVVRDARSAVSMALDALLAHLEGNREGRWVATQFALIVNLRSVRGEALFVARLAPAGATAAEETPSADAVNRVLPVLRMALLGLFKDRFAPATTALADACRNVAVVSTAGASSIHWQRAALVFDMAAAPGNSILSVAVTRLATRLESLLRCARAPEGGFESIDRAQVWQDVDILYSLMRRLAGDVDAESTCTTAAPDGPMRVLEALKSASEIGNGLKALGDACLWEGCYERWIEVRKLEQSGADRETMLHRLTSSPAPVTTERGRGLPAGVHDHFARAESALRRLESEAMEAKSGLPTVPSGESNTGAGQSGIEVLPIAVDEALLENLNLAAAEIRGARSRAEANLGSLRGGLQDMERTIKSLRTQLEALELDSSATAESESRSADQMDDGAPSGLGALSRGIEELQGLQDALHALTEETESVLASQASEDSELEHGLLKTRLVPVTSQIGRWTEAVGAGVRLDVEGGGAMLERRQAVALSDALVPLLELCVSEAGTRHIAVEISRPRFDLLLQIRFAGEPIGAETWIGLSAEFEKLGAFASRHDNGSTTVFRITVPGPPQSMDVVLVELGGQQFALPVEGVAGVVRRPPGAAVENDFDNAATTEDRSLAGVLGVPERPISATAEPTNQVLLAGESGRPIACRVDAVRERERVLVRSPGPLLAENAWILAVIVNEHAPPTLVLDLPALVPALTAAAAPA